jgi:hypothetical protein
MSKQTQAAAGDLETEMNNDTVFLTGAIKHHEAFIKELKTSTGGVMTSELNFKHSQILSELLNTIVKLNRNDLFILNFKTNQVMFYLKRCFFHLQINSILKFSF